MLCASCWKREAQWTPWMVSAGAEYGLTMADQRSPESSQADSSCLPLLGLELLRDVQIIVDPTAAEKAPP